MAVQFNIIKELNALGYKGNGSQNDSLTRALEGGLQSEEFRDVVTWLTAELHGLRKTDEQVSAAVSDPSEFAMELSAMLKELGCPYDFVVGPLSERFQTVDARRQLLDYLITELMATKINLRGHPVEESYNIPKIETNTARAMEQLTRDLGMSKPPADVAPKALLNEITLKVEKLVRQINPAVLGEPLLGLDKPLTDVQWTSLQTIQADLDAEYNLRRQMMLTRLELTISSFQWSDNMKSRENDILTRFQRKMLEFEELQHGGDDTNILALLAARSDLAIIEKTSSANVCKNTACQIQKHIIGNVPDRGGRAHEHATPPPEMPSWQQQRATGPGGGGWGGGRGGRGGGYNRGNHFRRGRGRGAGGGGGYWQQYSSNPPQRPRLHQGHDQNWQSGNGRMQRAGWIQMGNDQDRGDYSGNQNVHGDGAGGGQNRGRSNYNRGGRQRR